MADAALLFQWRNDGTSREIHNKKLDASTHLLWVEETLRDPGAKLFILMRGETPIGRIRVNQRDEGFVISCSIAAEYRRHGYGTPPAQRPRRLCGKEERSVAPHIRTPRLSVHGGIRVLSVYEAALTGACGA